MAEQKLLEIFEDSEFGMHPMSYDVDARAFTIGGKVVPLTSPDLVLETHSPSGIEVVHNEIMEVPVHVGLFGNPFATPKFYRWLQESCRKDDLESARRVMMTVFEEVHGVQLGKIQDSPDNLFGFGVGFLRPGHLTLNTIGNCACLGVSVDGHIVSYREWDTGFAEYEFHNIDMPAQRISLLAGMGHLALRAAS
jgi:hypothetical protein